MNVKSVLDMNMIKCSVRFRTNFLKRHVCLLKFECHHPVLCDCMRLNLIKICLHCLKSLDRKRIVEVVHFMFTHSDFFIKCESSWRLMNTDDDYPFVVKGIATVLN